MSWALPDAQKHRSMPPHHLTEVPAPSSPNIIEVPAPSPDNGASSAANLAHGGMPCPLDRTRPSSRRPTNRPFSDFACGVKESPFIRRVLSGGMYGFILGLRLRRGDYINRN